MAIWLRFMAVMAGAGVLCVAEPLQLATASALSRVEKRVVPEYPIAAKQLKVSGASEVAITVDEQGDVVDAKIVKGNAMFSAASLAAVKQWKFTPLAKDGAPLKFGTVVTINYNQ
jgi:TonB family protein